MLTELSVRLQYRSFASTYYGRQAPPPQHQNQHVQLQSQQLPQHQQYQTLVPHQSQAPTSNPNFEYNQQYGQLQYPSEAPVPQAQVQAQAQPLMYTFKDQHYIRKNIGVRIPSTNDDAIKVLMNWNFVRRKPFLCSLREKIVKFGTLTDKQMKPFQNIMISDQLNKAYVCYHFSFLSFVVFCHGQKLKGEISGSFNFVRYKVLHTSEIT